MKLYPHQEDALAQTDGKNRVAYYLDMGLGKTFLGSEKMRLLNTEYNLLICQKSKINDWLDHFKEHYPDLNIIDYTQKGVTLSAGLIVINYELAFRRPELLKLSHFTLMLDESSLIQNEKSKRSKFILKLNPDNVILLSGTPTSGKYEKLWSQLHLLGWKISKKLFWDQYVNIQWIEDGNSGFKRPSIIGYKNVDRLKKKLAEHGAVFMKSNEVFDLPEQIEQRISVPITREYRKFMRTSIVTVESVELVGDLTLTKRLYARQLCGQYNRAKLDAFKDLIDSTEDRIVVFYNFNEELTKMQELIEDRPCSVVNGETKDLTAYTYKNNSVTFVQYQAGAKGLNLQRANKIVYFTLTQSCEDWMQSKKRTHRIGQDKTCFYYYLICRSSVEEAVLKALKSGRDYTDALFEGYEGE